MSMPPPCSRSPKGRGSRGRYAGLTSGGGGRTPRREATRSPHGRPVRAISRGDCVRSGGPRCVRQSDLSTACGRRAQDSGSRPGPSDPEAVITEPWRFGGGTRSGRTVAPTNARERPTPFGGASVGGGGPASRRRTGIDVRVHCGVRMRGETSVSVLPPGPGRVGSHAAPPVPDVRSRRRPVRFSLASFVALSGRSAGGLGRRLAWQDASAACPRPTAGPGGPARPAARPARRAGGPRPAPGRRSTACSRTGCCAGRAPR